MTSRLFQCFETFSLRIFFERNNNYWTVHLCKLKNRHRILELQSLFEVLRFVGKSCNKYGISCSRTQSTRPYWTSKKGVKSVSKLGVDTSNMLLDKLFNIFLNSEWKVMLSDTENYNVLSICLWKFENTEYNI